MIRVVRILEYTYPDVMTMEQDMNHWIVPAHGARQFGRTTLRCAVLPLEYLPETTELADHEETPELRS